MPAASPAVAPKLRAELWAIARFAGPLSLANLLDRATVWITWALIGQHGGAADLGPAALASTVNNVLGISVCIGLSLAASTLASQASGAGDWLALDRVLQRAVPISIVFSLPVALLLLGLGPLLLALGRPADFCSRAASFALTILPVTAATGVQRAMQAWLSALQITMPLLLINLTMLPLHAALTWALVNRTSLGFVGAGIATSAHAVVRCGATYAYIARSRRTAHAWRGFRLAEMARGWGEYLKLAIPGVLMLSEYWVGEGLTFAASMLPSPQVALSALAVTQLANVTSYQLPAALRMAVSSRVGRALGSGSPAAAVVTLRAGMVAALGYVVLPSAALLGLTDQWSDMFTADAEVRHLLLRMVGWLVAYISFAALLAIGAGALTGSGRQRIGGALSLLSCAGVGLPAALALCFGARRGVVGIIEGHTIGKITMTAATFAAVARTRWAAEAERAADRVRALGAKADEATDAPLRVADSAADAKRAADEGGGSEMAPSSTRRVAFDDRANRFY